MSIVVVGYLVTAFYFQMKDLGTSVKAIENSNAIGFELEQISTTISKNESALRSFIISRDSMYLVDPELDNQAFDLRISRLHKLSLANPEFKSGLDSLKWYIARRHVVFDKTLETVSIKNYDVNQLNFNLLKGITYSDDFQNYINKLINIQQAKVRKQEQFHSDKIEESRWTASVLAILSLSIFLLAYVKMNADVFRLKKANDELKFLNDTFNNAEKIAAFGHWKVNLDTNVYTFSDNYFRLLGLEPQSFTPSLENIKPFIHPDDLEATIKAHTDSFKDLQPSSIVFRFVLANGEVKYMKSVGSFRRNAKGELVKIGVNYDITDQYLNTNKLSQQNKKLIEINAELESFNSIVSHDMQEPLRKIQMFISRLEGAEMQQLSDQGKDYFNKIRFSANRMQNLMIDLVNYARAIKGDRNFLKIDLNLLMKEVIDELSLSIEEKKAIIEVGKLPVVEVIPFQIQQLFVNLISNSLKYSKENVAPQIKITHQQIAGDCARDGKAIDPESFYKIVVADNGIGFRQEYAENIFVLFRRLETELKYTGTGLGLAICKKIAENHNGFIQAYGTENQGAEFHVFLPK